MGGASAGIPHGAEGNKFIHSGGAGRNFFSGAYKSKPPNLRNMTVGNSTDDWVPTQLFVPKTCSSVD